MRITTVTVAVLALALVPVASASLIEDALAPACASLGIGRDLCTYQHDGDAVGDASDVCARPAPAIRANGTVVGMVVPADDPRDNYALALSAGQTVRIDLVAQPDLPQTPVGRVAENVDLRVYNSANCAVVLAESAKRGSGPESLTFTAPASGVYTVQVQLGSFYGLPLAGAPPGGPGVDACNPTCQPLLNNEAGYRLTVK